MRMLLSAPMKPSTSTSRIRPPTRVASLLIRNPTYAADLGAATTAAADQQPKEPAPAPGVTTRARRRRRIAAAVPVDLDLPEEIVVWEIFVRVPAKDILRCRAVCRSWRRHTSTTEFLLAHHLRQPSLPLLTFRDTPSTVGGSLSILERCRPIPRFGNCSNGFKIQASCDGLLVLSDSQSDHRFSICNPATRQLYDAPFRGLPDNWKINIEALYVHPTSGEYRVLYWKVECVNYHRDVAYYVLGVQRWGCSSRLCTRVPSDSSGIKNPALHETTSSRDANSPPVVFRNCLHWDRGCHGDDASIVVFDTVVESFRFMRRPVGATGFCARLCDMEGSMGFSCLDDGRTAAKIWLLEDYEREVWSFKYHVKFPVESLCTHEDTQHLVLSHNGDVLVYNHCEGYVSHCDNTGKLIEEFHCIPWSLRIIGHRLRESLVKHDFFPRRASACSRRPSHFHRL